MQTFLFNPLFWVFIIISIAMFSKKKRWKIMSLLLFLLATNQWLSYNLLYYWEDNSLQVEEITIPYEIGVVLGPFIEGKGKEFSEEEPNCRPNDRFQGAIDLYEQGKFQKFLLTGNDNIEQTKALLMHLCVPPEAILLEGQSKNTYENALFSKKLLTEKGYNNQEMLLITSASHMRRARKCFDKIGLPVMPYCVDYTIFTDDYLGVSLRFIVPNEFAVVYWRILFREWASMFVFWMNGYI